MSKIKNVEDEAEGSGSTNGMLKLLLKEHKGDHYNDVEPLHRVISTGSLKLDRFIRIKSGCVVRLVGKGAELGKTSECFVIAQNYMDTMPKSKCMFIKAESRLSEEMQKRSGHKFVNNPEEWSTGTVFVLSCNVFETVAKIIKETLKTMHDNGEHLCIILDSLDGLILKSDLQEKEINNTGMVAGVPKLTKLLFRHLGLPINHYDALLLVTGQYSANISLDKYSTEAKRQTPSVGGANIDHQADYVISMAQRFGGDMILEDKSAKASVNNKIIGVTATFEIKKSAMDTSGEKVDVPIKKGCIGSAIWRSREVVDELITYESKKEGHWFKLSDTFVKEVQDLGFPIKERYHGVDSMYNWLDENEELTNLLHKKFIKLLG